jgi:hypothetical protein
MSFFHSCYLVLAIRGDVRASSLPKLLRTLRPAFAVRELSYLLEDSEDIVRVHYTQPPEPGRSPLWLGETDEPGALLTRYKPTNEEELLTSFEQEVGGREDSTFWMSVKGALRHRPPGADAADWFGRWWIYEDVLHEFFTIRITCKPGEPRELEFLFPLVGYPLTAAGLGHSEIVEGEPRTAQLNREELLPIIAAARDALGLAPDEARWSLDGELYADYPEDNRALEEWLVRMNAA